MRAPCATLHLTLKMTSAQVVETSVTNNSSSQNYSHPDDHTIRTTDTPGFKPFTMDEPLFFFSMRGGGGVNIFPTQTIFSCLDVCANNVVSGSIFLQTIVFMSANNFYIKACAKPFLSASIVTESQHSDLCKGY